MATFFTSDWHLGDPRVTILGRPFADHREMDEHIITQFNALVGPEDTTYMLGDVLSTTTESDLSIIERFNGTLHLIRGNHDRPFTDEEFLAAGFASVTAEGDGTDLMIQGLRCQLTHYPSRARTGYDLCLVGHVHGAYRVAARGLLNVGVDAHWMRPLSESQIVFYHTAICDFYDEDVWLDGHPVAIEHAARGKAGTYFETHRGLVGEHSRDA